ncbi:MAG: hypothetical protein ACYC27_00320 [Armatimonadota bacterium]
MKYINAVHILALLVLLVFNAGVSSAAPDLKSSKPRYAKIIMAQNSSKGISVIFDESKGTGKGYDTIYVDANMDGKFEPAEKQIDGAKESDGMLYHMFPTINIPSLSTQGKKHHSINLNYMRYRKDEHFDVTIMIVFARANTGLDTYLYQGELKPSTNPNRPFAWSYGQPPVAKIDSKPDGLNTGIAISLKSGTASITSPSAKVDLIIKNTSGKVVKKETGNLDKFAFG